MMSERVPSYFTCTLGEAARWNLKHPHSFNTVHGLIAEQARVRPNALAVGFPQCGFDDGSMSPEAAIGRQTEQRLRAPDQLSFLGLHQLSLALASRLEGQVNTAGDGRGKRTVGLLSLSSTELILTWIGLMRLGFTVLLIA
jgi:acyl-CoA synthetase (AMP-forming)/AMP-acid ligase II